MPRSLGVGAHGWVVGIASHGSLVMVEAPGLPRHPLSIQLNAVVNEVLVHINHVNILWPVQQILLLLIANCWCASKPS